MTIKSQTQSMKQPRTTISLNQEIANKLDLICKKYCITKSNVISILIQKYASKEYDIDINNCNSAE